MSTLNCHGLYWWLLPAYLKTASWGEERDKFIMSSEVFITVLKFWLYSEYLLLCVYM
jgi:hypothetical protein